MSEVRIFVGEGVQCAAQFDEHARVGRFKSLAVRRSTASSRPGSYYTGSREALYAVLHAIESAPAFFGDIGGEMSDMAAKSACRRTAARVRRELGLGPHDKYPEPGW